MKTEDAQIISGSICPCTDPCPLRKALSVVGGKWKSRIICTLYVDGTHRYNDILKKTAGITNTMLAASLRELEADGIITRTQFTEIPPRVEYALTDHGRELWPILSGLAQWAIQAEPERSEGSVSGDEKQNWGSDHHSRGSG